jgi:hypothetical protein
MEQGQIATLAQADPSSPNVRQDPRFALISAVFKGACHLVLGQPVCKTKQPASTRLAWHVLLVVEPLPTSSYKVETHISDALLRNTSTCQPTVTSKFWSLWDSHLSLWQNPQAKPTISSLWTHHLCLRTHLLVQGDTEKLHSIEHMPARLSQFYS